MFINFFQKDLDILLFDAMELGVQIYTFFIFSFFFDSIHIKAKFCIVLMCYDKNKLDLDHPNI